ncbi:MAG TPA: T9SS type A sorting domain-containing protein [Chitinophagales bacterium]|nr:T9SS type A sorting domain-containing protein [Chitinophagales bacterium]
MKKNLTFVFALITLVGYAQHNFTDSTYGVNGLFHRVLPNNSGNVYCHAVDSSGVLVLAGKHFNGNFPDHDWAIIKLRPDGKADSTFSTDGVVLDHISAQEDAVTAVGIQSDGKIVAAGYVNNYASYGMIRYLSNGSRDVTFGNNGAVTVLGSGNDGAKSMALAPDGKIYLTTLTSGGSTVLARYTTTGTLDSSFSNNGYIQFTLPVTSFTGKVSILPSGKILVYGHSGPYPSQGSNFTFVRLYNDGTIDSTFGTNGWTVTDRGSDREELNTIALQPDGKFIAAGTMGNGYTYHAAVTRYNQNGTIDNSFGNNGLVEVDHSPLNIGNGSQVMLRSDNKVVVMSICNHDNDGFVYLQRFNSDGSYDTTYANHGHLHARLFSTVNHYGGSMLADNKILFASWGYAPGTSEGFHAARFKAEPFYIANNNCHSLYTLYPDGSQSWYAYVQATGTGSLSYDWNWGDSTTSPNASASHTYSTPGNYNICLTIIDDADCQDTYCDSSTYIFKTEQSMIYINCGTIAPLNVGIAENTAAISPSIYPNPATAQLYIEAGNNTLTQINFYDVTGNLVMSVAPSATSNQISVGSLPSATYILEVRTKETSVKRKWIKL